MQIPVMYKRTQGGSFQNALSYRQFYQNKSFENIRKLGIENDKSDVNKQPYIETNKPHYDAFWLRKSMHDLEFSSDHDYE